jgi:hypothetical protein
MTLKESLVGFAIAMTGVAAIGLAANGSVVTVRKATSKLSGSSHATAKAAYTQCSVNGATCKKFTVAMAGGMPGKSYAVYVDDRKVGAVRTNSLGVGKLDLRTAAFIGSSSAKPMPSNFPTLDTGHVIRMGRMAGVFYDRLDDTMQEFETQGEFSDGNGEVSYSEEFEDGGLDRQFELQYQGAAPGAPLDVTVNGVVVYTVTADANGEVQLELATNPDDVSGDEGVTGSDGSGSGGDEGDGMTVQMPAGFPSIMPGDIVAIGAASATMGDDDAQGDDGDGDNGDDGNCD